MACKNCLKSDVCEYAPYQVADCDKFIDKNKMKQPGVGKWEVKNDEVWCTVCGCYMPKCNHFISNPPLTRCVVFENFAYCPMCGASMVGVIDHDVKVVSKESEQ